MTPGVVVDLNPNQTPAPVNHTSATSDRPTPPPPATAPTPSSSREVNNTPQPRFERAIKIKQRKVPSGEIQYLVLFKNLSKHWCDRVTPLLLKTYKLSQANSRKKRR